MIRVWSRVHPAVALLALLTGCDDTTGTAPGFALDPAGPLLLHALGDTVRLRAELNPDVGRPRVFVFASSDTTVAQVSPSGLVEAVGNGSTWVTALNDDGAGDSVMVSVSQAADSIYLFLPDSLPITSLAPGASLPVSCVALDRNGFLLEGVTPVVASAAGETRSAGELNG